MGSPLPYLEICFRPTIATINETRRMVNVLYGPLLGDPDGASRVALATHELLENALKYSVDGSTVIRVELSHATGARTVSVETVNAIAAERRGALDAILEAMSRTTDAAAFYQSAMKRRRTSPDGAGLGLARIWAEGEMRVSHRYEGPNVRLTALATFEEAA